MTKHIQLVIPALDTRVLTLAVVYFCNSFGLLVFPHASTPFLNFIALLLLKGEKKSIFKLVQIENELC